MLGRLSSLIVAVGENNHELHLGFGAWRLCLCVRVVNLPVEASVHTVWASCLETLSKGLGPLRP